MLSVYGVAPSEQLFKGTSEAEFPAFHGRPVGGPVLVDCKVSIVKLGSHALGDQQSWVWKPVTQGYAVALEDQPLSSLKNHLRGLRTLKDESGQNRLWPWFDPRYLKLVLRGLDGDDLVRLFGPVTLFAFALENGVELFSQQDGSLQVKVVSKC
ncbi:MAG: hypothetical protein O9274_10120 [Limnobacter sp.]|uniref:hypothetical protein n=1 Tax=Limnobacter sp. TaxID=2003368 RepID=UPI0022BD5B11|nr:hypothetical protein [Limnobacter sp.]MCZ8016041.1 hypothetical protein [Limnobacter sp.]